MEENIKRENGKLAIFMPNSFDPPDFQPLAPLFISCWTTLRMILLRRLGRCPARAGGGL
jgi:hypothetical protein